MKERILLYIWRLYLPKEEVEKRAKDLVAKEIAYYVRNTTGGGVLPLTFWEKVKILGLLLVMITVALLFYLVIFLYPPPTGP